eukprot:TRINITY_DN28791_c0_g1_i1.p1 TRINITY_DN28791_c0_g1~~TRINITY_DN28791_c0_g1_i1.p1  ORF type:complete len:776 (+),score=96.05 TRINITY_DN28791_c0_g1_i1:95-2422(+)
MPRPETLEPTSCQRDNQEGIDVPHKESNLKDVVLSGVNFRRLLREISVEYEQLRAQSLRFAGGQTDDPQDLCKFDGTVTGPELESKERDLEARQHGHHPVVNPQAPLSDARQGGRRSVRRDPGPRTSRFQFSDEGAAPLEDIRRSVRRDSGPRASRFKLSDDGTALTEEIGEPWGDCGVSSGDKRSLRNVNGDTAAGENRLVNSVVQLRLPNGFLQPRLAKLPAGVLDTYRERIQQQFGLKRSGLVTPPHVIDLLASHKIDLSCMRDDLDELFGSQARQNCEGAFNSAVSRSLSDSSEQVNRVTVDDFVELLLEADSPTQREFLRERPSLCELLVTTRRIVIWVDSRSIIKQVMNVDEFDFDDGDTTHREHLCELAMGFVVAANAITMGVYVKTTDDNKATSDILNYLFLAIFLIELILKLIFQGFRKLFYYSEDVCWNFFDTFVVLLGVFEVVTGSLHNTPLSPVRLLGRVVRLSRIFRMARIVRIPIFRELKLLLSGLRGMVRTLMCFFVLLFLILYFVAILMTQIMDDVQLAAVTQGQSLLFEDVGKSMFTVFRCLNIGDCSAADGTPLTLHLMEALGWPFYVLFTSICIIMTYGLGSFMTALIVDSTLHAAKQSDFKQSIKLAETKKVARKLDKLANVLRSRQRTDAESQFFFMSRTDFAFACQNPVVQNILTDLDIDEANRLDLFDALDADGNEHVEMQELIEGLVKMRGKARKADVVASRLMLNTLMSKVSRFEHHMAEELQITSDQVNTLCVAMSTAFPEMFSQMDRN